MASLRLFVARSDSSTSSSSSSSRPANLDMPSRRKRHFSSAVRPGARLVVAMAPELTIGLVSPSVASSTAITESKGRPVAFTPRRWRTSRCPSASQTSANRNGLATLWIVNGCAESPTPATWPCTPAIATPKRSGLACASAGM